MDRRSFYQQLGLVSLGGITMPFIACKESSKKADSLVDFSIEEITIDDLRKVIDTQSISIVELTQQYLDRIEAIDKSGPAINSLIYVNPEAISTARQLDVELKAGQSRGPLHGIPVILKDNVDTADMPTTAGSRALAGSTPPIDAHITKLLRAAGAIILAKANLSEWANFRGEDSSSGWSGLGGLTKNPYKLDRNTCGSSAGSGAAVAASLCAMAIGTETNGSIVCPSSTNGVVGIKPTVGLVSRSGIIPISSTQDTAGPMARTVRDATICLGVLVGKDAKDSATEATPQIIRDYTPYLDSKGLKGKRIAYFNTEARLLESDRQDEAAPIFALMADVMAEMKAQGAEIIDIDNISEEHVFEDSFEIMLYEYKQGLNDYFKSLGPNAPIKSIDDLISWNRQDSIELKYFGQEYLEMAAAKAGLDDKAYLTAQERMLKGRRELGIDRVMNDNKLDAIIAPTGSPAWKTDLINGDTFLLGSSSPAAQAGYPNICVPMGFIDDLPVGLSIFGRAWSEPVLISIAYAYEQATHHRQAPKYLPA